MKESLKKSINLPESNEDKAKEYEKYVKAVTPTHNVWMNMLKAFICGGLICVVGQVILNVAKYYGADKEMAASINCIVLILISIILTGFGLYARFAKFAGAGALVPITGFANSVGACAIEYKKEGQVFGIGCKIFTIAGPVILYGTVVSWALGMIYWIIG